MLAIRAALTFALALAAAAPACADATDDLLMWVRNGNMFGVNAALSAGADPNARLHRSKRPTLLHVAAKWNFSSDVVALLLDAGADPNARDEDGDTPLHWAAWNRTPGGADVIMELLDGGADPDARNKRGFWPYDYFKRNDDLRVFGGRLLAAALRPASDRSDCECRCE